MTDQMTAPVREVVPIGQIVTDDLARNRVAVAVLRDTRRDLVDLLAWIRRPRRRQAPTGQRRRIRERRRAEDLKTPLVGCHCA